MACRSLPPCVSLLGVGIVEFLWPCAGCLGKSELLVPCVELTNDDSKWGLCVWGGGGLSLSRLFVGAFAKGPLA
jgi:hypothetical protein